MTVMSDKSLHPPRGDALAFTFLFICLFAAFSFEGCSQRAKDDADRKAIVGDWDYADDRGIWHLSSDGTYWQSNKIFGLPPLHSRVAEGKWNITNGELVLTDIKIGWYGDKDPKLESAALANARIVRITEQELALAFELNGPDETKKYFGTNILRRSK